MTVSMFDSYLERKELHRTERMMDMSQASFYAQLTNDSRRKLWNGWMNIVFTVNMNMIHGDAANTGENPITWNGRKVSIKGLIQKFVGTFGKGSVQ